MYVIFKIGIIVVCLAGISYFIMLNSKYKKGDANTTGKEDIIKYFEEKNAINLENGIRTKELPEFIAKSPY